MRAACWTEAPVKRRPARILDSRSCRAFEGRFIRHLILRGNPRRPGIWPIILDQPQYVAGTCFYFAGAGHVPTAATRTARLCLQLRCNRACLLPGRARWALLLRSKAPPGSISLINSRILLPPVAAACAKVTHAYMTRVHRPPVAVHLRTFGEDRADRRSLTTASRAQPGRYPIGG